MSNTLSTLDPIDVAPGSPEEINGRFRSYDFNRGDRRFFDHQAALDAANEIAAVTGVRQIVRATRGPLSSHPEEYLYLVQAVGS